MDTRATTLCVKSEAAESGAAALALVSELHGVPLSPGEVRGVSGVAEAGTVEEETVLVMARALGFEAVAMEGAYGDLVSVALPLLVALKEGDEDRYAVLYAFDGLHATVGDPATGERRAWSRERFCGVWTGSVVQLTPVEAERRALAAELAELRDPVKRAARLLGWTPPYGRSAAISGVAVAALGIAAASPGVGALDVACTWFVAAALAGSVWSWLGASSCAPCGRAKTMAPGLPLAEAGAALYAVLLLGKVVALPAVGIALALGAAVGTHVVLLGALARERVACAPCVFVAACATGATFLWCGRGDAHAGILGGAAVVTGVGLSALLPRLRARAARVWQRAAESLVRDVAAEPRVKGSVRVVAFTRRGCSSCALFEAAVKPALRATFDGAVSVEERDPGKAETVLPLILVLGGRETLFIGLPTGDAAARIFDAVREALASDAPGASEMTVHLA